MSKRNHSSKLQAFKAGIRSKAKPFIQELFSSSANDLATRYGCSQRLIYMLRREAKESEDPVKCAEARARQIEKRAQREIADSLRRQSSMRRLLPGGTTTKLHQIPSKPGDSLDRVLDHAEIVRVLYYVVEFLRHGGSRELYCVDHPWDNVSELLNLLLPDRRFLSIWICPLAQCLTLEEMNRKVQTITEHRHTVVWAIHAADSKHAALHIHVVSRIFNAETSASVQDLKNIVGFLGRDSRLEFAPSQFLSYLDNNSSRKPSLTGVKCGRAASPEFACIHYYSSAADAIRTTRCRNLHGVVDLAELLNWRARNSVSPFIPLAWERILFDVYTEADAVAFGLPEGHPCTAALMEAACSIRLSLSEIRKALISTSQQTRRQTPPTYLGRASYYSDLFQDTLRWSEEAPKFHQFGLLSPNLEDIRLKANCRQNSKKGRTAMGIYSDQDADIYWKVLMNPKFFDSSYLFGFSRYMRGDRTLGDSEPPSVFRSREISHDFLPMVLSRLLWGKAEDDPLNPNFYPPDSNWVA